MSAPKRKNSLVESQGKIAGMYDLFETLGRGHFAVVKLAKHVFTGEKVAVKVIDKSKLDEISRAHLFQEVRCMKLVQHPHVVRLYEVIDTQTKLYLILELGDGGDMYDYIMKHEKGLSEKKAKTYFRQIVHAIQYCHKLHVVHRDLKPENVVFFRNSDIIKLTDFGFSNKYAPGQKLDTACGSLAYSAPEILLGDSYDAPAVDVWSLGVIMYMLVCGRPPFQETNDSETLTMILDCKYTVPPHISSECKNIISMMLQRDPEKRATLDQIAQHPWLKTDEPLPTTGLPLISREMISDEDHAFIIQKMLNGNIAQKEEILRSLERDEYDHVAATYYLLAERRLKKHAVECGRASLTPKRDSSGRLTDVDGQMSRSLNAAQGRDSPSTPEKRMVTSEVIDSEITPRVRTFSIVAEEDEEEETGGRRSKTPSPKSSRTGNDLLSIAQVANKRNVLSPVSEKPPAPVQSPARLRSPGERPVTLPNKQKHFGTLPRSCDTSNNANARAKIVKSKTLPRQLKTVKSSPQLALNEIFEEGESDDERSSGYRSPYVCLDSQHSVPEGSVRMFEQRRKLSKHRTGSTCSSSEASDDDSEIRKEKLKNIPRRDSHDDSGNEDRPPGSGGGGGGSRGVGSSSVNGHTESGKNRNQTSKPNDKKNNKKSKSGSSSGGKQKSSKNEIKVSDSKQLIVDGTAINSCKKTRKLGTEIQFALKRINNRIKEKEFKVKDSRIKTDFNYNGLGKVKEGQSDTGNLVSSSNAVVSKCCSVV